MKFEKYDNAIGGSDDSHDPNPSRNPNYYLSSRADNFGGSSGGGSVLLMLLMLYCLFLSLKNR